MTQKIFPATGMPDPNWWRALWPDPARVLRDLGIQRHMTVLDLCCGDGYFTAPLATLVQGSVYALDLDPALLQQARTAVEEQGASVLKWICGDARDLAALVSHRVDYVLIANTFHGVPDKVGLLRSVGTVLRSGGRLGLINWHALPREETVVLDQPRGPKTRMRMSPEQTQKVVEPQGFELERVVQLPPYHYGAVFLRRGTEP